MTIQFRLFLAALSLVGLCVRADAADIEVTVTHPSKFVDGAALSLVQLESWRFEYGTCAGTAFGTKLGEVVTPAATLTAKATGLTPGAYCLRAYWKTTLAAGGLESYPTNGLQHTVPWPKPGTGTFAVVNVMVFEAKIHPVQGLVAGRQVGTIKLGAICYADANGMPYAGADLYRVPLSSVRLSKTPRSELLIAKCGVKS